MICIKYKEELTSISSLTTAVRPSALAPRGDVTPLVTTACGKTAAVITLLTEANEHTQRKRQGDERSSDSLKNVSTFTILLLLFCPSALAPRRDVTPLGATAYGHTAVVITILIETNEHAVAP